MRRGNDFFGTCPRCHQEGVREIGTRVDGLTEARNLFGELEEPGIYMTCVRHKLKWRIGTGYSKFTVMVKLPELKANHETLKSYKIVEPIPGVSRKRWQPPVWRPPIDLPVKTKRGARPVSSKRPRSRHSAA